MRTSFSNLHTLAKHGHIIADLLVLVRPRVENLSPDGRSVARLRFPEELLRRLLTSQDLLVLLHVVDHLDRERGEHCLRPLVDDSLDGGRQLPIRLLEGID